MMRGQWVGSWVGGDGLQKQKRSGRSTHVTCCEIQPFRALQSIQSAERFHSTDCDHPIVQMVQGQGLEKRQTRILTATVRMTFLTPRDSAVSRRGRMPRSNASWRHGSGTTPGRGTRMVSLHLLAVRAVRAVRAVGGMFLVGSMYGEQKVEV